MIHLSEKLEDRLLDHLRLMQRGNSESRGRVLSILINEVTYEHHEMVGVVGALLQSPEYDIQHAATVALRRFGPKAAPAQDGLIKCLLECNTPLVVSGAAEALGAIPGEKSCESLLARLSPPLTGATNSVFAALGEHVALAEKLIPRLRRYAAEVRSEDPVLAVQAESVIEKMGREARATYGFELQNYAFLPMVPLPPDDNSGALTVEEVYGNHLGELPTHRIGILLDTRFRFRREQELGECRLRILRNAVGETLVIFGGDSHSPLFSRTIVEKLATAVHHCYQLPVKTTAWIMHFEESFGIPKGEVAAEATLHYDPEKKVFFDAVWEEPEPLSNILAQKRFS